MHALCSIGRRSRIAFVVLCVLVGGVVGCGYQTYESRMGQTVQYFQYLERVDAALEKQVWNETGIKLRAPKPFRLIPPPTVEVVGDSGNVAVAEPEPTTPADDPRQPKYIDGFLPGLVGAWDADLPCDTGNEKDDLVLRAGYFYVLSNYQLWLDFELDQTLEPDGFHASFSQLLSNALQVEPIQDEEWVEDRIPSGIGYVAKKNFQSIILEQQIDNVVYDFTVYRYVSGDIQVVLLFVLPQGVDPREKMADRIKLCLEQLTVSGEKPTNKKQQSGTQAF